MAVNQKTNNPTNKLTVAVVISCAMGWAGVAVQNFAPGWYDPVVWSQSTTIAIGLFGFMFKDEPNV